LLFIAKQLFYLSFLIKINIPLAGTKYVQKERYDELEMKLGT